MSDLIDEDFMSRSYENVKALHVLFQRLTEEYQNDSQTYFRPGGEKSFIFTMLKAFFKFRNKCDELKEAMES